MQTSKLITVMLLSTLLISLFACKNKPADNEHDIKSEEETGPRLTINEKYDTTRNGVRLILSYDRKSFSFNGTVENVTNKILKSVRVEVHLSDGTELGPTSPIDLPPGKKDNINLSAKDLTFSWWKAHPEVGEGEHGHKHGHEQKEKSIRVKGCLVYEDGTPVKNFSVWLYNINPEKGIQVGNGLIYELDEDGIVLNPVTKTDPDGRFELLFERTFLAKDHEISLYFSNPITYLGGRITDNNGIPIVIEIGKNIEVIDLEKIIGKIIINKI